jgi:hypothetical protein
MANRKKGIKTVADIKSAEEKKAEKATEMQIHNVETGTLTRYQVRNTLFRLRDDRVEEKQKWLADLVWSVIQPQLKHPEGLKTFTFTWDVNPNKPLHVIRRDEWDKIKADKYPDAYKKQEQVEEEITLFTGQA